MAKPSNKRLKAATLEAPQSREETQSWIKALGDTQREHARLTHDLNDKIAELTDEAKPALNALAERSAALQQGIQAWCEANRAELTAGGGKTVTSMAFALEHASVRHPLRCVVSNRCWKTCAPSA